MNSSDKTESEKLERGFKFYLYINMHEDMFADPIEILDDYLDFSSHKMCDELLDIYNTTMFKIFKRQYSVEYGEMQLQVEPFYIPD
jgi:hypothetical protein